MELNEITRRLPPHLLQFVVDQPYQSYTPVDQAVWRYVMRQNYHHLRKVAHESYVEGLQLTGVEIDQIPTMYGMNRILKDIGWASVAVDGFIPPGAFMEFTKYNVLVIAADIRTLEHIEYTPAPDIIHESAGHAPIIAVPEFAAYLKHIGEVGSKAFSSQKDVALYEAIRHLSIIKEDPSTMEDEVAHAELDIERIQANMGPPSEMALIRNLHWWTVEYGLIGTVDDFKLYGAGLLSSIGEGMSCLGAHVKKIHYTLDAMNCNYDITRPQPQLFVTPSFSHLTEVLDEFKATMAWTTGGRPGLQKAIDSQQTGTAVYSSGLQVSGTFGRIVDDGEIPVFVETSGPAALALDHIEMKGYGKKKFPNGFSSPVGRLANGLTIEDLSDMELNNQGIRIDSSASIKLEHDVVLDGTVRQIVRSQKGKVVLFEFEDARVAFKGKELAKASPFVMAVGSEIVSVFAGPADIEAFEPVAQVPHEKMHKPVYDAKTRELHELYAKVREARKDSKLLASLADVWSTVVRDFPGDWLLSLEILEVLNGQPSYQDLCANIEEYLITKSHEAEHLSRLVSNGLKLLPEKLNS